MSSTSLWLAAGSSIESQDGSVQVTHRAQPPRRASSISRRVIRSRKTAIPASPLYVFDRTVGFWGLLNSCGEEREETASHISEASSQRASRRPPVRHASTAADGRPVLRASLLHAQRMSMVDNGTRDFARDQLPPHSGGQPRPLLEDEADSEGHRDQQRLLRGSASYNVFPAAQDEPRDTFTANHEAPGLPITDAESEPLSFIDRRALSMMMQGDSGTAMAAGSAPKQLKATKQRVLHGSASYTAFPAGPGLPGSAQPIVNDLNSNAELDVQRGADRPGSATSTSAAVSESSSRPPWQWPEAAPTPSEPSAPTPLVTAGQMSSATTGVRNSPSQSSLGELIDRRSSSPRRSSYVPSVQMTFMDDAYLLMEALEELLRGNNIPFSEVDAFRVVVQPAPRVSLDVEVCQLPTSLYAVRFSRLFGETNQFKLWCTYILNLLAARWREQGRASALPARWSAADRVPPVPTVGYPTAQTLSDLGAPERLLVQSTSTDKAGLNADGDETTLTKSDSASSTISASSAVGTLTPTISPAAARTPRVALISPRHTSVILASSPIIDVVDSRDVSQPESASHSPSPHTSSFLVAPNEHRRAHSESSV
ncbi:hypothetical protein CAOG_08684 [Capsaspora owczarzaki ATCC 30864]|nr:hypothetical protein CAOG_08684 [Capsaspora owczarzaki ATCC 30864]|eukprot:XP_011270295.1 hypothetical protein CAOG_08684 [Capsaspora owczarzaki ATCC 30864]